MSARKFYNGNELHSFNFGVSPAGMAVAHSKPSPSLPSQEQRAYESYAAYSRRIGAPVMDFEKWYAKDCGIGGTLFSNYLQFHGMSIGTVGRQDFSLLRGYSEPAQRGWSGTWDNAVRVLEG